MWRLVGASRPRAPASDKSSADRHHVSSRRKPTPVGLLRRGLGRASPPRASYNNRPTVNGAWGAWRLGLPLRTHALRTSRRPTAMTSHRVGTNPGRASRSRKPTPDGFPRLCSGNQLRLGFPVLCPETNPGRFPPNQPRSGFPRGAFARESASRRMGSRLSLVGATRFERATPWSQTKCATRLRYAPMPVETSTS